MLQQNDVKPAWTASRGLVDPAMRMPWMDDDGASDEKAPRSYVDLLEVIAALTEERDRLLQLATRDYLTGIWNRRAILEILAKACASAEREQRPFAVIMADVDEFKGINDRLGHPTGDIVLRETARRLSSCIRRADEVGRYGGEEFLIVLAGCGGRDAVARAEHLRTVLESEPVQVAGGRLRVTCSFGVYAVAGGGRPSDEIVHMADIALYRAKRGGRNRVEMFEMGMAARSGG